MAYQKRVSDEDVLITEGAVVTGDVILGKGVNIWYYAVLRGDQGCIEIGENSNIQEHCLLHAGSRVGRGCTIGHKAIVHGCTVGDNTLIGMGAVILDGARIGRNCVVGAGALVTGKTVVPDGSMILGSPAKVVRMLTEEEIEKNRESAQEYLDMAKAYRDEDA